jgi:hypothetical protein
MVRLTHMGSFLFALSLAAASAEGGDQLRTIVLTLEVREGVQSPLAAAATEVVQVAYAANPRRRVLREEDLTRLLDAEASRSLLQCSSTNCLQEMGRLAKADRIVFGAVAPLGTSLLLTISEVDARTLVPIARGEEVALADLREVTTTMRNLARDVETRAFFVEEQGGSLELDSTPPGVIVDVDGRPSGVTPVRVRNLPTGMRRVTFRPADGPPIVVSSPVALDGPTSVMVEFGRITPPTDEALIDHADDLFLNTLLREVKLASCAGVWFLVFPALAFTSVFFVDAAIGPPESQVENALFGAVLTGLALGVGVPFLLVGVWGLLDLLFIPAPPVSVETPSFVTVSPPATYGPTTTQEIKRAAGPSP